MPDDPRSPNFRIIRLVFNVALEMLLYCNHPDGVLLFVLFLVTLKILNVSRVAHYITRGIPSGKASLTKLFVCACKSTAFLMQFLGFKMTPNTVIRLYNAPQHLQLSATTIRRLIKDGEIRTVSLGKRAKGIMQSEIDSFLERRTNAQ